MSHFNIFRYNKCLKAGMKPGLVLSDVQCQRRFGPRKTRPGKGQKERGEYGDMFDPMEEEGGGRSGLEDEDSRETGDSGREPDDPPPFLRSEDQMAKYKVLVDTTVPLDKRKEVGRELFLYLFLPKDSPPGPPPPLLDVEEDRDIFVSFQISRQMSHSQGYVSFTKNTDNGDIILSNGQVNTFNILQVRYMY